MYGEGGRSSGKERFFPADIPRVRRVLATTLGISSPSERPAIYGPGDQPPSETPKSKRHAEDPCVSPDND